MCIPYGFSVRVNATEALPDELKYKDWGTGGSEQIKLNLSPRVFDGRAIWKPQESVSSIVRPEATPYRNLVFSEGTRQEANRWLHQLQLFAVS